MTWGWSSRPAITPAYSAARLPGDADPIRGPEGASLPVFSPPVKNAHVCLALAGETTQRPPGAQPAGPRLREERLPVLSCGARGASRAGRRAARDRRRGAAGCHPDDVRVSRRFRKAAYGHASPRADAQAADRAGDCRGIVIRQNRSLDAPWAGAARVCGSGTVRGRAGRRYALLSTRLPDTQHTPHELRIGSR